ncbi:MAG: penicillin-binding protein activator [Alphaproteobacteria bacterium]|nr:penicillin-binding protein activator [Alphaproteobacteria bacterium]
MTRVLQFFMWTTLLIGLTSCTHKPSPETLTKPIPSPVPPKVKTPPPASPLTPLPQVTEPRVHKVGLLLPLSGPHAALGKGMQDAAEMALFESETSAITLLPKDTAPGAYQAALKAIDEGAELLLGPIFATEVEAIKPLLKERNVNLICFSTDQNVAGHGTYVLGFLPYQQVERAIEYAKGKGFAKIAALLPEDQYGHLIDQNLKRLEAKGELQLIGVTYYSKGDILEGNPGNARLVEELANYKLKGLEILFIPEGGENLVHLMRLLSPHFPLKILGSGQWDATETLRIPGLEGGFFASTDPQERQHFETRFQKAYGTNPLRVATLAYDATALAIALADKGYDTQNLTFRQGFSGIDGIFRLTPQGISERGLAVLEINPSGFRVISPAPSTF